MSFPYRIVVADDERVLRRTAELLLGSQGYEIRTAADGFEALVELHNGLPDVLVSDLSMPISRIAELLGCSPLRPIVNQPDRAPVWIPRTSHGYFVVTCTECLRSFPVKDAARSTVLGEAECIYCGSELHFLAGAGVEWELKSKVA